MVIARGTQRRSGTRSGSCVRRPAELPAHGYSTRLHGDATSRRGYDWFDARSREDARRGARGVRAAELTTGAW